MEGARSDLPGNHHFLTNKAALLVYCDEVAFLRLIGTIRRRGTFPLHHTILGGKRGVLRITPSCAVTQGSLLAIALIKAKGKLGQIADLTVDVGSIADRSK
jgi:hypothetical protein